MLVWHRQVWWDRDRSPWVGEWERCLEPFWDESVRLAGAHPNVTKKWKAELEDAGLFEPLATIECRFVQALSAEDFVALVASFSWLAILPSDRRSEALSLVRDLVQDYQPMNLEYRTEVQHSRLRWTLLELRLLLPVCPKQ
jgi:hypothetical protein